MYRAFIGHDPDINPYLEYYGLPTNGAATVSAPTSPPPAPLPPAPAGKPGERGR
jgi:hypothetical protein